MVHDRVQGVALSPRDGRSLRSERRPVLIAGIPRSGTTWLSVVLAANPQVGIIHEPDNHWLRASAFLAKHRVPGRTHPVLGVDDHADELSALWAIAAGRAKGKSGAASRVADWLWRRLRQERKRSALRTGKVPTLASLIGRFAAPPEPPDRPHLLLRSVYVSQCLDWVASVTGASPVVVIRHPFNVISSWIERGWLIPEAQGDPATDLLAEIDGPTLQYLTGQVETEPPSPSASQLRRATYLYGLLFTGLSSSLERHPDWLAVTHEELCAEPVERIGALAAQLGIPWSRSNVDRLDALNQPGEPYSTQRPTPDQASAWRRRLSTTHASHIEAGLEDMGLGALAADPPG